MNNEYSFAGQYRERSKAIIPQDKYTKDFLYDVDCETKGDVAEKFGSIINYNWHCNTIANTTIESIIKALNTDMHDSGCKNAKFDFYNLFTVKVTTKINESAEKEGNINVSFEPGPAAIALINTNETKLNTPVEKETYTDFFRIEIPKKILILSKELMKLMKRSISMLDIA